jgi:FkbM family methyltransferase
MSIERVFRQIRAIYTAMLVKGPEGDVSKSWLLKANNSLLCRKFMWEQSPSITTHGEYTQIAIGKELFLWPAALPVGGAMQILSEIFMPAHPHQYIYGPTQIGPDDVVLDIGACEGSFAALVTSRCKSVIVVEPSRTMCRLIEETFKVRNQACPVIMNCLLGEEPSTAYFVEDASNPAGSRMSATPVDGAYELPVMTLDQLVEKVEDKPTFIKCDAEGAAAQIYSGGLKFLTHSHPKLATASYHTDSEYLDLYALLKSYGYSVMGKGFYFQGNKLRIKMIHAW